MLQLVGEISQSGREPLRCDSGGRAILGRERRRPGTGERPLEVEGADAQVVDPIGHGRLRDRTLPIVRREDAARVGERAVLLVARASFGGEEASDSPRRVRRESVRERGVAESLLKRSRRGRDLEGERRRELAMLDLEVECLDELLEKLEPAA